MHFTFKKWMVFFIFTVCFNSVFGAKEKIISSLTGSGITTGFPGLPSLLVEDQKRSLMAANSNWYCQFGNKVSTASVILRYDDSEKNTEVADWTLTVTYSISLYNTSNTPYATFTSETATINFKKSPGSKYQDIFLKTYDGALRAEVSITSVLWVPSTGSPVAVIHSKYNEDIYFEVIQETERYYNFNYNGLNCTPAVPAPAAVACPLAPVSLNQAILSAYNNELPVSWNFMEGAESYDLEWLFVDVPEAPLNGSFDLDFSNATRVNVFDQNYRIPMAYPRGILVYRVRGVGVEHEEPFAKRMEGPWSVTGTNTSNLIAAAGTSYIKYYDGLDKDYNWQYSAAYAEDGKRKEVISYFDGSYRNRQSATILNSDNNIVIAESKYDFQGRPSVSIMPTPITGTGIHYYPNFNPNFNKFDFDVDGNFPLNTVSPAKLDGSPSVNPDQTAIYYGNSLSATGADAFVPDANGDAYTQSIYSNDGTGRVIAQSGVGSDHKIGGGHETTYDYGTPSGQEELDRLFGNEAGNFSHYKKNMVFDANGQCSVTYLDQQGRVVASALKGNTPQNLLDLDDKPASEIITVDMLTGKNNPFGDGRSAQTCITASKFQKYDFEYFINLDTACVAPPCVLCRECVYDLEISVYDKDRNRLHSLTGVTESSITKYTTNSVSYDVMNGSVKGPIISAKGIKTAHLLFSVTFPNAGVYYVDKVTVLNTKALTDYTAEYVAELNVPCEPLPNVAPNCTGDGTCVEICNDTYGVSPNNTPISSANTITTTKFGNPVSLAGNPTLYIATQTEYLDCPNKCANIAVAGPMDPCNLSLMVLQKDMSPGGQYFDNKMDVIGVLPAVGGVYPDCSANNYPGTYIANVTCHDNWLENNLTPDATAKGNFWAAFTAFIGGTNSCSSTSFSGGLPSAWPGWPWMRTNWKTCFADFMVSYHPEYCAFTYFCDRARPVCYNVTAPDCSAGATLGDSKDFDHAMKTDVPGGGHEYYNPLAMAGATSAALTAGYPVTGTTKYISDLSSSPVYPGSDTDPYFSCNTDQLIYCRNNNYDDSHTMNASQAMKDYLYGFMTAFDCPACYPSSLPPDMSVITTSTPRYNFSIWYVLDDPHNIAGLGKNAISGITLDPQTVSFFEQIHGNGTITGLLNNPLQPLTKYDLFKTWYLGKKDFYMYAGLYSYNCTTKKPFHVNCSPVPGHVEDYVFKPLTEDAVEAGFTPAATGGLVNNTLPYAQIRYQANPMYEAMLSTCPAMAPNDLANALSTFTTTIITDQCQDGCSGYADAWIQEIKSRIINCYPLGSPPTIPSTFLDNIKADLIAICAGSCDGTYPQGQDHVSSPVAASDGSSVMLSDFNDVYNHYLGSSSTYGFCASLIGSININHPPQPFLLANCICDNLKQFAINNGIICEGNPGFNQDLADKLNEYYDIPPADEITVTDVSTWMSNCFTPSLINCYVVNSTPPTMAAFAATTHTIPASMICIDLNATTTEPDPCEQANEDADYETGQLISQFIANRTYAYAQHYKKKCIDALLTKEAMAATYELDEFYYTLYYYDQANNLIKTVPPRGFVPIPVSSAPASGGNPSTSRNVALHRQNPSANPFIWPKHTMVTYYKYNTLNQIREQLTPDGGKTNFYYDVVGRLVVSQNDKQRSVSGVDKYSYTTYDRLARITEVGEVSAFGGAMTQDLSKDSVALKAWFANSGNARNQITRTYYDEAPYEVLNGTASQIQSMSARSIYAGGIPGYLRNRVSCTTYQETDFNHALSYSTTVAYYDNATHYSYDMHGNVSTLFLENTALKDFKYDINRIDYNYDLISGKVNEVHYNAGKVDQFHHQYAYDADNRITAAYTSRNGILWEKEAKYFYYKHGPLQRVELGDKQVQASDYAYTLHGWVKGVNSNSLEKENDIGQDGYIPVGGQNLNSPFAEDAYGYSLGYYGNDYTAKNPAAVSFISDQTAINPVISPVASIATDHGAQLFNGNIGHMATSIYLQNSGAFVKSPIIKSFRYDQLNRIKNTHSYNALTANAWNAPSASVFTDKYKEDFKYDFNGNITELNRYDNSAAQTDGLAYMSVSAANNQLKYVTDGISGSAFNYDIDNQSTTNYEYDAIGNLIKDESEGIPNQGIEWSVYGKIRKIHRTSASTKDELEFIYDAVGNRIEKIVKPHASLANPDTYTHTYYLRDAQGNVMATYTQQNESGTQTLKLDGQQIYGSSRLGILNEGSKRVDSNAEIAYQADFKTGAGHGFIANGATAVIDADERLKVTVNANAMFGGVYVPLSGLSIGQTYEVSLDVDKQLAADHIVKVLALDNSGSNEICKSSAVQGRNSYRFTARTATTYVKVQNESPANALYHFFIDNVFVKEITTGRLLGHKNYELSNHLGNVLSTVSDRKIGISTGGSQVVFEEHFNSSGSIADWFVFNPTAYPSANISWPLGGKMRLETMQQNGNAAFKMPLVQGVQYTVDFDAAFTSVVDPKLVIFAGSHIATLSLVPGSNSITFTALAGDNYFEVLEAAIPTGTSFIDIDNIVITAAVGTQIDYYTAEILSSTDYYAFGSTMPGRNFTSSSYRYGFNGMEKDDEIKGDGNSLDFGARIYDSRLGRFLSLDPRARQFMSISPYCYAANNPVRLIDIDGEGPGDPVLYQNIAGKGNVIVYLVDNANSDFATTFTTSNDHWDIIAVTNIKNAVDILEQTYGQNVKINNLIVRTHGSTDATEQKIFLGNYPKEGRSQETVMSPQDFVSQKPGFNFKKEQAQAYKDITKNMSNNGNIFLLSCHFGDACANEIMLDVALKSSGRSVLNLYSNQDYTSGTKTDGNTMYFNFDEPLTNPRNLDYGWLKTTSDKYGKSNTQSLGSSVPYIDDDKSNVEFKTLPKLSGDGKYRKENGKVVNP